MILTQQLKVVVGTVPIRPNANVTGNGASLLARTRLLPIRIGIGICIDIHIGIRIRVGIGIRIGVRIRVAVRIGINVAA
jgi:hypothetical protein